MLEGCFQDRERFSHDPFFTYRFFLQARCDEPFKRRETKTLVLKEFNIQETNFFLLLSSLAKNLFLRIPY